MQGHFDGLFFIRLPKLSGWKQKKLEKDFLETKDSTISEPLLASTRKVVDEGLIHKDLNGALNDDRCVGADSVCRAGESQQQHCCRTLQK